MSASPLPARLPFLDARAKARAVAAVEVFERQTSAELVITVKQRARSYSEVNVTIGALLAFLALIVLLFAPVDFTVALMPLGTAAAFAAGHELSRNVGALQRAGLPEQKRRECVEQLAKASFVDLGVSRTSGRTGVLVCVALFERTVAIVSDIGVTAEARTAANEARTVLEDAVARRDVQRFADVLEQLGVAFGRTMPRAADDKNELSDTLA
jgi:putative membrane protein